MEKLLLLKSLSIFILTTVTSEVIPPPSTKTDESYYVVIAFFIILNVAVILWTFMSGSSDSPDYTRLMKEPKKLPKGFDIINEITNRDLGTKHATQGEHNIAITFYSLAINWKKTAITYNLRGVSKKMIGDIDGSIEDFTKAIELDPRKFQYWFKRGECYENSNKELALNDFKRALELGSIEAKEKIKELEPQKNQPPKTKKIANHKASSADNKSRSKEQQKSKEKDNPIPKTLFIKPEEEKRTQIKFIGYEPNNLFCQKDPLNYPYVVMPKPRSVIKFPRKNKVGNMGYSEENFLNAVEYYFENYFSIYNDRILIISSNQNPYEPDIALIDEFTELNLFIDIEIDEPYDGITREPMHFKGYDNERNIFFENRGWLTIRFAEEQVWNYPQSCCKFIFKVIYSLSDHYAMPYELDVEEDIKFIPQWTFDQARYWSEIKYREQYLDNDNFRKQMINKERGNILDSELENKIEEYADKQEISSKVKSQNIKETIVKQAINTGKYISCKFNEDPTYTILKPQSLNGNFFSCYCYLKNKIREFNIDYLTNPIIRDQPSLIKHNNEIGVDEIKRVVKDAIQNNKKIRMKYTRGEWTERFIDEETGEIIENRTESEQSLRTISNIDYAVNVLDERRIEDYNLNSEDYISAYCHKREAQRIFRFDRIDELEILNI